MIHAKGEPFTKANTVAVLVAALVAFAAGNTEALAQAHEDSSGDPLPLGALVRMGSLRLRQEYARVAFSPDGKILISLSHSGGVHSWDMRTGGDVRQPRIRMPNASEAQTARFVGLSPGGKLVVVGFRESLLLYDTSTAKELRRLHLGPDLPWALSIAFDGPSLAPESLVFSRDGKILAYRLWSKDHFVVRLWDSSAGKELPAPSLKAFVGNIALSSDGKLLASWDRTSDLRLWDTPSGRELRRVSAACERLVFSPDGKTLATWRRNGKVSLWDTATLKKRATLQLSVGSAPSSEPVWSADGTLLAAAEDREVVLWDVAANKERRRLPSRNTQRLAFTPDGKTLACSRECLIDLWDTTTGTALHHRPGHDTEVTSVTVSPDGKVVASTSNKDPVLRLWDTSTGKPLPHSPRHPEGARCSAFSGDGKLLVSGGGDSLRLWTADGKELRCFGIEDVNGERGKGYILVCHLSADGQRVAAVRARWDGGPGNERIQLSVWDTRTGKLLANRPLRGGRNVLSSRFSTAGNILTLESRQGLVLQDTITGQERATIAGDLGNPVAFSPDDALLAVGLHESSEWQGMLSWRDKGFRVVERATGEELFHKKDAIDLAAFSPHGHMLATVNSDDLCLWDAVTGELLFRRSWPSGSAHRPGEKPISSLAFLPNGQAVVTGMGDGTLLVWDLMQATRPKPTLNRDRSPEEFKALWSDLGSDVHKAYRAIYLLAATPRQALPFLAEHLRPAAAIEAKHVQKLLSDLDSEQFARREAATQELMQMGEQVEPALRRALEEKPSLEVRRRIQEILVSLRGVPTAQTLRTLRALRILERIGTPEARRILQKLAGGAPAASPTREAAAAVERLARRPAALP